MAMVKYSRVDANNNSSNYCVSITCMVFVLACLVGALMSMSSSVGSIRSGTTYEQFMGVIPKVRGVESEVLKGTANQGNVQDVSKPDAQRSDNVPQKKSLASEAEVAKKISSQEEKEVGDGKDPNSSKKVEESISGDGENDLGNRKGDSGENGIDRKDQNVTRERHVDGILRTNDRDGEVEPKEIPDEKDLNSQKKVEESAKENEVDEKKSNEKENRADTEDQQTTRERADDGTPQNNESAGKPGLMKSPDERKQVGEAGTTMKETRGSEYKKPPHIQDGVVDHQIDKSSQEQSMGLKGGPNSETSGSGYKELSIETSTGVAPSPTQSAEVEKKRSSFSKQQNVYRWKVCNVSAGSDYIPCLDNIQAIRNLKSTKHYEHRERHCPDEAPTCLVPLPKGYRAPIRWPKSRDMIWFANVPHTKLADYKGQQNWVKVYDRYLTFPGGGTQFKYGALHYVDFIQQTVPDIAWGKRSRVVLDVGCGVASFGGYLFDRDVLTMSLAPKDEHEAQVQFALERGIPAISAVMGTKRLPFPSMVFDVVHCARCRVPWHIEGGKLLLELNRVLRPGGYFVWSATPVYRRDPENSGIWKVMSELTKSMCWDLVQVGGDVVNRKKAAVFRKPTSNDCFERRQQNDPPLCEASDDPNAAWYAPLQPCMHKVPTNHSERGSQWPPSWPLRLEKPPSWLRDSEVGHSDKPSLKEFIDEYNHWKQVVADTYMNVIGIDWLSVRNVMDMKASYGGFAAALKNLQLWVMNVVPVNSSDTLPIIYERGLVGIYHDWCESFSTYPRSYDLLHADYLFSHLKKRCKFVPVMAEVDRLLRPGGWLIVRDDVETISEVESMAKSLHWKIQFTQPKDTDGILSVSKTSWRPAEVETIKSDIA